MPIKIIFIVFKESKHQHIKNGDALCDTSDTTFMLEASHFGHRNFDFLIPDAPELVFGFLEKEQDASCKRNAFMMLVHADQVGKKSFIVKMYLFMTSDA